MAVLHLYHSGVFAFRWFLLVCLSQEKIILRVAGKASVRFHTPL